MDLFELDPRLVADTHLIGDFPLCRLLLSNDANYPWFILVPRRAGVQEIYQLDEADQRQLIWESSYVAEKLKDIFNADKMNVAAIGNVVSQLHVHHIVRYRTDAVWPDPVWGKRPAVPYTDEQVAEIRQRLQTVFTTYLEYHS